MTDSGKIEISVVIMKIYFIIFSFTTPKIWIIWLTLMGTITYVIMSRVIEGFLENVLALSCYHRNSKWFSEITSEKQKWVKIEILKVNLVCYLILGTTIDWIEAIRLFHEREWRNLKVHWCIKMSTNMFYQKQNFKK